MNIQIPHSLASLVAVVMLLGFVAHVLIKCGTAMLPFAYISLGLSLAIIFAEHLGKVIDRRG